MLLIQSMDQGVIMLSKKQYIKKLLTSILENTDGSNIDITQPLNKLTSRTLFT